MSDDDDGLFITHGLYSWANAMGCEVQLSKCGDGARTRYTKHDGTRVISEWREIIEEVDEDGELQRVISDGDCGKIPLDLVMRVPDGWNERPEHMQWMKEPSQWRWED
jgi:hypothetical protein